MWIYLCTTHTHTHTHTHRERERERETDTDTDTHLGDVGGGRARRQDAGRKEVG